VSRLLDWFVMTLCVRYYEQGELAYHRSAGAELHRVCVGMGMSEHDDAVVQGVSLVLADLETKNPYRPGLRQRLWAKGFRNAADIYGGLNGHLESE
jgi:hypothetical protein